MRDDPIVAEVRSVRLELEEECDSDFKKIYLCALATQKQFENRVASHPLNIVLTTQAKVEAELARFNPTRKTA